METLQGIVMSEAVLDGIAALNFMAGLFFGSAIILFTNDLYDFLKMRIKARRELKNNSSEKAGESK